MDKLDKLHFECSFVCIFWNLCSITPSGGISLFVVCSTCSIVPGEVSLQHNATALTKRIILPFVQLATWPIFWWKSNQGKPLLAFVVQIRLQWSRLLYWWSAKLVQFCSSLKQISWTQGTPQQSLIPTARCSKLGWNFGKKLVVDVAPPPWHHSKNQTLLTLSPPIFRPVQNFDLM